MKKVYLIDVSAMFFRAYYAIRPLSSPTGLPVNAIYGFMSMLIKLIKDEKPEYMIFCYDRKEPSFRKALYDGYKANRTEMPEDLAKQIPYIKQIAGLLGVKDLEVPDYEADDIIGSIVAKKDLWNAQMIIVSGDKDFSQLVQDNVILYDTMKDVRLDSAGVKSKWGVSPEQFIDYLAIVGDSSDNVPGVKGIGEKGALKLLEQFQTLEKIYEQIDAVDSKSIKQKLIDSKEMAFLSKKLVTIVTSVPVSERIEDYRIQSLKRDELRKFLQELNFKTFEKSLLGELSLNGESSPDNKVSLAQSSPATQSPSGGSSTDQASVALVKVERALLTEKVLENTQQVLPFEQGQELWGVESPRGVFVADAECVYELPGEPKSWGAKFMALGIKWKGFDLKSFWHRLGISQGHAVWDSMLAAYVLKARDTSEFAKIYESYCHETLPELASASQVFAAQLDLADKLEHELEKIHGKDILEKFDLPLANILLKMENRGIALDKDLLKQQSIKLEQDISVLEKQIIDLAGEKFNVASPKQLGVILFEKLGLEAGKKTKTGYSTDNEVLQGLDHPIAPLVLEFRELSKLKSTYVDALPQLADEEGRVHTSFNQALTTTGRLSSTHPNLQNIPIRTPRGQEVRKAFVAGKGLSLLSADYSQIELRVLAHISEDPNLIKAFADDLDIHAATAAEIYGLSLKEVTSDLRRAAKAVNFGIAYGQGAFGLAENLGISRSEAKEIIDRYFTRFKNVKDYIENTIKSAHEKGYVETLFGRRRYIEELSSKNMALKKFGERAAINAPIQGTASDLVKLAMIELDQKIEIPMLLQVHDELIFEGQESKLHDEAKKIISIMENVTKLKVPLKVNYAIGLNWDEAH
ncbi:MAG: DNA polymerase I [Bdellovibrionia bacterium]